MSIETKRGRVVVAGTRREEINGLFPFAKILAHHTNKPLVILGLVAVAEGQSLSTGARAAQKLRARLETLARNSDAQVIVHVGYHIWNEVQAEVGRETDDLLLLSATSGLPADALREMPCDVVIVQGTLPARLKHILLPIRGGPYAPLALEIALAFAQKRHAEITVLHAASGERLRDRQYREFLLHLRILPQVTHIINLSGNASSAIIRYIKQANDHQLVVMGAIAQPQPGDPPIGPTAMHVMKQAKAPVLVVKAHRAVAEKPPTVDYTISVVVDKWFAENTFHAHEFQDLAYLVEMKKRQGLTISLGLPTLNEEKTIGRVIQTMRTTFMQRYPLLDEIVVIDSNSTDRTVEIAQKLRVPVYRHPDILPEYKSYVGKGEALWKSLYVLQGDLIAWIDTDIVNIHPRFVYGILGPLLKEPRLMYVKGFYQRPLRLGSKIEARGGGRVTELMARPLLNLFYPELSGMIQPLAGEYAGRRLALERVPFFTGYGVETGLLIDLLNLFGLHAIGQVDLEERIHRNQSLLALSKMAYAILQVVMQRIGSRHHVELLNELNASMKLIRYSAEEFHLDVAEIRDHERPPIISLEPYRQKRGLI
jgi:glucosyl-3-phosphoglycerate synthase